MNVGIRIDGDKIILENLRGLINDYPQAVKRGLSRSAKGIHSYATSFLSGGGGNNRNTRIGKRQIKKENIRTGFTKGSGEQVNFNLWKDSGRYPVPVRTGNLRRLLNFVEPGRSKTGKDGQTFTAGAMEAIVYNSAEYARVIHFSTGSSAKFGHRQYLFDALEKFNQGNRIAENIAEEISADIAKRGLA